jgi:opacity protein-like surface antigen
MKKTLAIISFIIFITISINAQLRVGVVGGFNSPKFKAADIDGTFDEQIKGSFGAVADYNVYDNLFLDMKILYQDIYTGGSPDRSDASYLYKSFFLTIPLSVKYEFGNEINPYISAGISFNYNFKTDVELEMSSVKFSGDFSNTMEDISFSAFLGCGLQFNFSKYAIFAEGNYSYGLTNVLIPGSYELRSGTSSLTLDIDEDSSVKINVLDFLIGVKIPVTL